MQFHGVLFFLLLELFYLFSFFAWDEKEEAWRKAKIRTLKNFPLFFHLLGIKIDEERGTPGGVKKRDLFPFSSSSSPFWAVK